MPLAQTPGWNSYVNKYEQNGCPKDTNFNKE